MRSIAFRAVLIISALGIGCVLAGPLVLWFFREASMRRRDHERGGNDDHYGQERPARDV